MPRNFADSVKSSEALRRQVLVGLKCSWNTSYVYRSKPLFFSEKNSGEFSSFFPVFLMPTASGQKARSQKIAEVPTDVLPSGRCGLDGDAPSRQEHASRRFQIPG